MMVVYGLCPARKWWRLQSEPYKRAINGDLQALGETDSVSNRSTVLTQLRLCSSNECTFIVEHCVVCVPASCFIGSVNTDLFHICFSGGLWM